MKTMPESKWRYIGTTEVFEQKYHMFENLFFENSEILLVTEARIHMNDGTSIYYDKIE